jgi:hypothetical protein
MQDQQTIPVRGWPGSGTGVKTDAYSTKMLKRHERQYDAVASHTDLMVTRMIMIQVTSH